MGGNEKDPRPGSERGPREGNEKGPRDGHADGKGHDMGPREGNEKGPREGREKNLSQQGQKGERNSAHKSKEGPREGEKRNEHHNLRGRQEGQKWERNGADDRETHRNEDGGDLLLPADVPQALAVAGLTACLVFGGCTCLVAYLAFRLGSKDRELKTIYGMSSPVCPTVTGRPLTVDGVNVVDASCKTSAQP